MINKQVQSNRELLKKLQKGDITVSDLISSGGYLNPIQSNRFIRTIIDAPTIINEVRTVPMNAPTMEINKIGFGSRILTDAPSSGVALAAAKRSKPTTSQITLTTKEVIAEVHIPYDVLEDNIERGSMEDTIMFQIGERAALDLEELILLGDTLSGDTYLALMDGILKRAVSHVVDFSATPTQPIDRAIFKEAHKAMPNKYIRNRNALRHYVSPDIETEYADTLAGRETVLGDSKIQLWTPNRAFGVQVKSAALMPDGKTILTFPKNIIWGVQRKIMIETDRDIRARTIIVVLTLRVDTQFEEEDAVVKVTGLHPNGTTTTT